MRAVVTGAAGFIGSHLVSGLLDRGFEVVGVDCFTDYYPRPLKEANLDVNRTRKGFSFVEARIQDADLQAILDGATHVFHLAAQAGVRKSWGSDFASTPRIAWTRHSSCLKPASTANCIASSTLRAVALRRDVSIPMREDALPQPVSPYGVTKLAAEQLCYLYKVNHGVPTTALRYFTVYGPRQRPDMAFNRFIRASLDGQPISLYGDGEQTRDFTFVADAVAATMAAGDKGVPGRPITSEAARASP